MAQTQLTKRFSVKGATIQGNTLAGNAAGIGNMDRGGDVIFPGFFAEVLGAFLEDGFSPTDHSWDWKSLVAMPKVAQEKGQFLYTEAVFHGTTDAQEAKQKCQERMDNGLSVGLSIGFSLEVDGYKWFTSGQELLDHAKKHGYDLKLFDAEGIKAWAGPCRGLLKCAELFEYSIVCVPMNPAATATGVKVFPQELTATGLKRFATAEEIPGILAEMLASGAELLLADGTRLAARRPGAGEGAGASESAKAGGTQIAVGAAGLLKSQYLGENIEIAMTMEAVYELTWTLYSVISQNLFGTWQWDDTDDYVRVAPPLDEALATIRAAAQEYSGILLRVVEAIMRCAEGAQTPEDAEKALTALTGTLLPVPGDAPKGSPGDSLRASLKNSLLSEDLPAGKSFKTQLTTALAAVKGCTERARAIAGLRLKEGRVLSQDNRDKLAAHRDALQSCLDTIDEILAASEPKGRASATALRKARRDALLREAAPFLAP